MQSVSPRTADTATPESPRGVAPAPPRAPDALEQRDRWRQAWQFLTSDWLLAPVCILLFLGFAASFGLPQAPAEGQQDALAFSQWQAQARDVAGPAYAALTDLGLFNVFRAFWFRLALAVLGGLAGIRLADRIRRLIRPPTGLEDEARLRVTEHAPAMEWIIARLRTSGYQIRQVAEEASGASRVLCADRGPIPLALSIGLHLGLALIAIGAAWNGLRGWDLPHRQVDTGVAVALPSQSPISSLNLIAVDGDTRVASLRLNDTVVSLTAGGPPASAHGVTAQLLELTPKFRLTALDAARNPLTLTTSSYAPAETSVIFALRANEPELAILLDQARLVLFVASPDAAQPQGRLRAARLPSGSVLGEWPLGAKIDLGDATVELDPLYGGVIALRYAPGDPLLWAGAALAALGLIAVLLYPARRIVVRQSAVWTEIYASGRGARTDALRLRD
ncbi:MAG: cytochrome c biogenesis protein ResB [Thermoflexales bacterium]